MNIHKNARLSLATGRGQDLGLMYIKSPRSPSSSLGSHFPAETNAMSPLQLAEALGWHGIHVNGTVEGTDQRDGNVSIADIVYVQVPTFGGAPRVVVDSYDTDVRCYPPRLSVADLADDIRDAVNKLTPAGLASCSIH